MNQPPRMPKKHKHHKKNEKSLENLTPIKPGEIKNPWGRRGKDGQGGRTLKESYRTFMGAITEQDKWQIWQGLLDEGKRGNTRAIQMLIELGGEQVNDRLADMMSEMPRLTIQIVDPLINGREMTEIECVDSDDGDDHGDDHINEP